MNRAGVAAGAPGSPPGNPFGTLAAPPHTRTWLRFAVVQLVQLPAVGLALYGQPPFSFWCAGIWGGIVCVLGTDSVGPWRNRFLRLQAIAWLILPLLFGF